jgi:hypothetical protein
MYYVGVPTDMFMMAFDGFECVDDQDLPGEIDSVVVGDVTSEEFKSRFRFRSHPPTWIDGDFPSAPLMTPDQLDTAINEQPDVAFVTRQREAMPAI